MIAALLASENIAKMENGQQWFNEQGFYNKFFPLKIKLCTMEELRIFSFKNEF